MSRLLLWSVGCAVLLFAFLQHLSRSFDFASLPYEDAAILIHYAENIAEGHGIVWNVGGDPIDGATDFLYMIALAGLRYAGLSFESASHLLGGGAHVLTCAVVFVGLRRLHGTPYWMSLLATVFLAFGPALRHLEALFGTPCFGLLAATTWYATYHMYRRGVSTGWALCFSLSGLVFGLVRPEGVFLTVFFLLTLGIARGWGATRKLLAVFVVAFGLPGAIYFFWRWSYFGHPLPNPYYIKGNGALHWGQAVSWLKDFFQMALPCALLMTYGGAVALQRRLFGPAGERERARADWNEAGFVLLPFLLFAGLSVLHEGLMDYQMRFTYFMLPIALMSWPPFLRMALDGWGLDAAELDGSQRAAGRILILFLFVGAVQYSKQQYGRRPSKRWGTYDLAVILSEYPSDYTMAVTNAGHLPLFSRWNTIDVWGLNDFEIARNGLSEELLERERPELLQFDVRFSPLTESSARIRTPWIKASRTMKDYAEKNGYILAAAYGATPYSSHYLYVRPDFPESDELVRRIREMDYFLRGKKCVDLSQHLRQSSGTQAP